MVKSKFYNLDTDTTLGGANASDLYVASEKAVKTYVDNSIPTVNNATLTIQKNGTTVKTFTANASTNVTANITVPTTAADVGALPDTTFIPTITDTYSATSTDGMSGKAVASAISTKQDTLSSTNKLNASYINQTASYRFVTDTEKSTWNGKQDAISDLATIRSGASAGATALQPGDNVSELTNDAGYITGVTWNDVTDKPSTFTPSAHNQASDTINALTGYSKSATGATGAIVTSDTLNKALAKLENALDSKQPSGSYVPTTRTVNNKALSSDITLSASDVGALPDSTVIPVITDTYSATSSNGMSGKAVASAISNKADKATSLSGYGITDAYTKTEIDGKLSGAMHFKGTVASVSNLPTTGNIQGDMYNVTDTGANYAWDGTKWDKLSENIDLSGYVPTSRTINGKALTGNITLSASDVNALPDSTVIPTTTSSVTSGSTAALTSGGAYTNLVTAVVADGSNANKIKVTKAGTTTTITVDNVAHATSADSASSVAWSNVSGKPTKLSDFTDDLGSSPTHTHSQYLTGITSSDVTTALGYTPYNSTNPSGYQANVIETIKVNGTAQTVTSKAVDITVPTNNNQLTNGAGYITNAALADYSKTENTVSAVVAGSTADKINVTKNGSTSTITVNNVANAVNATKATQDASGNVITTTYATKSELPTTTIRIWS